MKSWKISGDYDQETLDKFRAALGSDPLHEGFDLTLSREWGEAAELSYGTRVLRYALIDDERPVAIFQGVLRTRFGLTDFMAGYPGAHPGFSAVPGLIPERLNWFVGQVLQGKVFSRCMVYGPEGSSIPGFRRLNTYTIMVDLRPPFESLLKSMKKVARYDIRRAARLGLVVEISNSSISLEEAYEVIHGVLKRKTVLLPSMTHPRNLHRCFGDGSILAMAYARGQCVSAGHFLCHSSRVSFLRGASTDLGYRLSAARLVHVEVMRWAKEHGYLTYDIGATSPLDPAIAGIHHFKMGFGGILKSRILWTREKPFMRLVEPLYTHAAKLVIGLRRMIHRSSSNETARLHDPPRNIGLHIAGSE